MVITKSGKHNTYTTLSIDSVGELNEVTPRNFNCIIHKDNQFIINRHLTDKGSFIYYITVWAFDGCANQWYKIWTSNSFNGEEIDGYIKTLISFVDSVKRV